MFRYLLLFSLLLQSAFSFAQNESFQQKLDSIESLRKLSRNVNLDLNARLNYAKSASQLSKDIAVDSTILKSNIYLSYIYSDMDAGNLYRDTNISNLKLAAKLKDSSTLANVNFGLGFYYAEEAQNDSAYYYYYNAEKLYHSLKNTRKEGEILLNIADIQETYRDYIGSEETAVRAIKLLESVPTTDRNLSNIWALYNLLAVISAGLELHDEAIKNYESCLEIANKMSQPLFFVLSTNNNIASSYGDKGDFEKALSIYYDLINDKRLKKIAPKLYVVVLENIAYTRFLNKDLAFSDIENQFKEAYRVGDSLDDTIGKMKILGDWSQFNYDINNKEYALRLAKENYELATESNSNDVTLKALKLMSDIEGGFVGKGHLDEYIKLNDSLIKKERQLTSKFARIRFEVDKIEADNEKLAKERQFFLTVTVALLIGLALLFIIISQRAKNRKLKFIQTQQETNEEIYNLMLAQQDKVEEGRTQEKKRISEDLHDGILGKLFGTRLSLDSLNLVQTEDATKARSQYINELKNIEAEIRKISHDLNSDFVSNSSFIDIIKALIETQTTAYQLKHEFKNDEEIDWEDVPNKTKIHIYRMLQETMQNIYKHANATVVKISFQLKNSVILCAIEDDGAGFNVNKARKGIGLKNIDSRINEIGGKAEVYSKIDIGTVIKFFIPVE